jgi:glycine/D-amino acid oxidase-like deaminating enzyme
LHSARLSARSPQAGSDGAGRARVGSLRFADADLRLAGWSGALGLERLADTAVSTTALHWLPPDALAAMYAEVATVLRPGGLLLNGDHLTEDEATAPTLARLGRALNEREERRRAPRRPVRGCGLVGCREADAVRRPVAAR